MSESPVSATSSTLMQEGSVVTTSSDYPDETSIQVGAIPSGVDGAPVKLESSAGTGHFYTTVKNKTNTPGKLEMKKYDPVVRKHVVYKETKLK